jgi:hypothetical protein
MLDPAERRALALLAALPAGKTTEEVMFGLGYKPPLIAELAHAGLVRTTSERLNGCTSRKRGGGRWGVSHDEASRSRGEPAAV